MDFGTRLRLAMDARSLSANELARQLKMHPSAVYNWLKGKSTPRRLEPLALALGVEVGELSPREDPLFKPEGGALPIQAVTMLRQIISEHQSLGKQIQQLMRCLELGAPPREG